MLYAVNCPGELGKTTGKKLVCTGKEADPQIEKMLGVKCPKMFTRHLNSVKGSSDASYSLAYHDHEEFFLLYNEWEQENILGMIRDGLTVKENI